MTTVTTGRVIARAELAPFGGSRITDGQSSANLWSDGVVLASAWSITDEALSGLIFTFRGSITRSKPWAVGRVVWTLRKEDGTFVADYPTRREAVEGARRWAERYAFRWLNDGGKG